MVKRTAALLALLLLGLVPGVRGQEMQKFYLVPVETVTTHRGPKYFYWSPKPPDFIEHPGILPVDGWGMMDYGFTPWALLVARGISQEDHDALILNDDVFAFPDNLEGPVDQDVQPFFEAVHIPTDWLTPSTTWRELLRQMAGMFQFNQRYNGISGGHSIFENATLDTRLRQMTTEEQIWFLATVESFGYDPALVDLNAKLRLLVRQAGDYWIGQTFYVGGVAF